MSAHSALPTQPPAPVRFRARVLALRELAPDGFELTLERAGLRFMAGQLLSIHGATLEEDRNYTICSGEADEHLQILFRLIPGGRMTPRLARLRAGDTLELSAPLGEFTVHDATVPLWFIATGTGVAPCRSYLRSGSAHSLTLVHGVRAAADLYYREEFSRIAYHPCVSSGADQAFHGRVTDVCATRSVPADAVFHLCGSNAMFYDMLDVLTAKGVARNRIRTEAYYYGNE